MLKKSSFFLVFLFLTTFALAELPPSLGPVTDYGYVLSDSEKEILTVLCQDLLRKKGVEMFVVTVKMTAPLDPAEYARRLYYKWGLGGQGGQQGILFLLAKDEQKLVVEVGPALKGSLPPEKVNTILDRYGWPSFKEGVYGAAILKVSEALVQGVDPRIKPMVLPKIEPPKVVAVEQKDVKAAATQAKQTFQFKWLEMLVVMAVVVVLALLYVFLGRNIIARIVVLILALIIGFMLLDWAGALVSAVLAFLATSRTLKGTFHSGDFKGGFSGYRGFRH